MTPRTLILRLLRLVPMLLFVAIFDGFGSMSDPFLKVQRVAHFAKQASFIGIVAFGMTVGMLTYGVDLSVGASRSLPAVSAVQRRRRHRRPLSDARRRRAGLLRGIGDESPSMGDGIGVRFVGVARSGRHSVAFTLCPIHRVVLSPMSRDLFW